MSWDGTTPVVSDLMVPHREDYHDDHYDTDPSLGRPMDWTFSTVRHWGTRSSSSGQWKLSIRDAIQNGATAVATPEDPVVVPVANPTDPSLQRVEGVAIVYHGSNPPSPFAGDPPSISSSSFVLFKSTRSGSLPLNTEALANAADGKVAFPVTSWDFFYLPDLVPVHPPAPPVSPFEYFPHGVNPVRGIPPATALYPGLLEWPATPAWVPVTAPPPAGAGLSSGAVVSRPRWAELSPDGKFIVLRDPANNASASNYIYARLNRARGIVNILPLNTGNFTFTVIAENLAGISKPKSVSLRVFSSTSYATWSGSSFPADTPQDQRSPEADPDGDGQANLLEFAFNTLPASSSSVTAPEPSWFSDQSGSYPAITFPVMANRDVTSSVEFSSDMISWDNHAVFVSKFVHTNGTVMETWRAAHPSPASGQPAFGRVRVGQ